MPSFRFDPLDPIPFKTVDPNDEGASDFESCLREYFLLKYPVLMDKYGRRKQVDDLTEIMSRVANCSNNQIVETVLEGSALPKFVMIPYEDIIDPSARSIIVEANMTWAFNVTMLLGHQNEADPAQDISHFLPAIAVTPMLPTLRRKQQPKPQPPGFLDEVYRAYFKSTYHNLLAGTNLQSPADLLIQRIRDIFALNVDDRNLFYANFSSVIQGSGSGKSRLVKECSREFYVVYLCLRPEGSSGVPPRSELTSQLLALANSVTKDNCTSKIDQFFAAMFYVIASKVATDWLPVDDDGRVNPQTFWKYIVEENSADFASSVKQTLETWGDGAPKLAKKYMMDAMRALDPSKSSAPAPNGFVVVLDEARSLLQTCPAAQDSSLFLLLRSWMNSNISTESFFLLLDTTSRVTNFYPTSPADDPSARIAQHGSMLHRPIFEFPFLGPWPLSNNLRTGLGEEGFLAPVSVWTEETSFNPLTDLFRFSRPVYLHVAPTQERKIEDARSLVSRKLFGKGDDKLRFTVAVCYRYALRPYHVALQDKLLGSHGATLTAINDDRSLVVRYLPEPLVGEALCHSVQDKLSTLLDTIVQQMTERELIRTLSPGDRGELASTVYLLHGYETATLRAIQQRHPQSSPWLHTYSGLLRLGDWIATFAGVPLKSPRRESVSNPDVAEGHGRLMRMLSTCCVSFTGWTEAHEPVISEMLTYAYCHRVGFVCNGKETAVDMVLPLVLGPAETPRRGESTEATISEADGSHRRKRRKVEATASATAQRAASSSTAGPLLDDTPQNASLQPMMAAGAQKAAMVPTLRSSTRQASATAVDDIADAAATETMDDPEGLDDLAQAKKRRFLPAFACPGLGAVTVQVKNYAGNLGMGEAFRYCWLQVERLLETAEVEPQHVVSMLCVTGRGCVTAAQLPGSAPLPVLLFVEVGQPTRKAHEEHKKQPEPTRSAFVGVVINGFQEHLVGTEVKEKLMTLTATLSGPRSSKMLTDQYVRETVAAQLNTICARQDARLPGDFEVPSFTPKTKATSAAATQRKSAATAPPSTWCSRLIDVTSEGIDRCLLVWFPGTPSTSK